MIETAEAPVAHQFEIHLPQFEGPFDLLLFFIERDELEIQDIPISQITKEFLDYIHCMDTLNMDLASEFILVAATLMRIKSRMLLPVQEKDDQGNDIDPRQDLVEKLMAYKQFKEASRQLQVMEEERMKVERRGNALLDQKLVHEENTQAEELFSLSLYSLLKTYQKVLIRLNEKQNSPHHTVFQYPYTIERQKQWVMNKLETEGRLSCEEIIENCHSKIQVIFSFLAILEMLSELLVSIVIGSGFNNFKLELLKGDASKTT